MSARAYAVSLITLCMSVWVTPGLEDVLRVYVIGMVAFISLLLGLVFRVAMLRDLIVRHIVAAVLQEVMRDPDVLKIISWKERRERISRLIRREISKREKEQ